MEINFEIFQIFPPLCYVDRLKSDFFCPRNWKKMEKRRVRRKKNGFGAERNELQAKSFFEMELIPSIFYFLIFFFLFLSGW